MNQHMNYCVTLSGRKVIRRLISSHVLPKAKGQDSYDQATSGPRASTGTSSRTREFVQLCREAKRTQYSPSLAQVNYEKASREIDLPLLLSIHSIQPMLVSREESTFFFCFFNSLNAISLFIHFFLFAPSSSSLSH